MSGESRDQALQHIRKAESELGRGRYIDALQTPEKAGRLANESEAPDVISLYRGCRLCHAIGSGYDEALKSYTIILKIQEGLAEHEPFFNTWVATTLNNLGLLLSRMGRIDDAKERYERALKMYEELLEGDSGNVTHQSLDIIILLFRLGCSGLADALLTRTIPKYIYG